MRYRKSNRELIRGRRFILTSIAIAVVAAPIALGLMSAPRVHAQAQQTAEASPPSFEVASIKEDHSGTLNRLFQSPGPGRFSTLNMPAKDLIEYAYNIKPFQLSGGPGWTESQGYNIEAKAEDSLVPELEKLPRDQRIGQFRLMLRSLLAERFKLTLSHEMKDLPMFALVVAKGGPKLTPTTFVPPDPNGPKPTAPQLNGPHLQIRPGMLIGVAQPMSGLVDLLAREPDLGGRMVVDQTGIKGNYDFTVQFTQEAPFPNAPLPGSNSAARADSSSLSIFTAIQEQLGLKLESTKGPVESYIIEHIEQPSEN